MTDIQNELFRLRDLKYRDFHARLMPTVDKELIIGIRTPQLRKFADKLAKSECATEFLQKLPHKYYEENNLHAFIIEKIHDFDELIVHLDSFLPHIDNWATCDMLAPKAFKKHLDELLPHILRWINSSHIYTVRFAVVTLMKFYLDNKFSPEYFKLCASVPTNEYYLSMAVAWYFATALTKQWDVAIPYITERRLDPATHNRTVQKAIDSFRISDEHKAELRNHRIKQKNN